SCAHIRDLRSPATIRISRLRILLSKSDFLQDRSNDPSTRPRADGNECSGDKAVDSILRRPRLCSSGPSLSGNLSHTRHAEFHSKHFAKALRAEPTFRLERPSSCTSLPPQCDPCIAPAL